MNITPLERFEVSTSLLAPEQTPGGPSVETTTTGVQPQQAGSPTPLGVQVITGAGGMTVDTGGVAGGSDVVADDVAEVVPEDVADVVVPEAVVPVDEVSPAGADVVDTGLGGETNSA